MFQENDIVQIIDEDHHWFPCLVIVSEPKPWGVQGYVHVPQDNMGNVSQAYIRLKNEQVEKVGFAVFVCE